MRGPYTLKQNIFKLGLCSCLLFSFVSFSQAPAIHGIARAKAHQKKLLLQSFLEGTDKNWRRHCNLDVINRHQRHIEAMARKYGVLADSGRYILCYEYHDDQSKDMAQDWLAKRRLLPLGVNGFFPDLGENDVGPDGYIQTPTFVATDKYARSEAIARNDLTYFFKILEENRILEEEGQQPDNAPRNGRDHWIFSTVGIAEFGIFTALSFVMDGHVQNSNIARAFQNASGEWDLNTVAQELVNNEELVIEILFARIKNSRDVYIQYAYKDILYSFSTILQLHTMGYFKYHALQRENNLKEEDLPDEVLDCFEPEAEPMPKAVPAKYNDPRG
ncbi:MAG TPA: hypothetical protein PKC21_05300 [Oligoflexia bacterium]|nr:hypothetical protein [Oligoflexia bacterium]HMR24753.1 hypothetical protein [Oligoflexia bacterium]